MFSWADARPGSERSPVFWVSQAGREAAAELQKIRATLFADPKRLLYVMPIRMRTRWMEGKEPPCSSNSRNSVKVVSG